MRRNHAYYCEADFSDANLQSALMRRNKAFPAGPDGKPKIDFDPIAYHMENVNLVDYLEWRAREDKVDFLDATVASVGREGDRITWLQLDNGQRLEADFFVDASGFRALLIGETLQEPFVSYSDVLFCDRAVIGPRDREKDEPIRPYTTVETMEAGWCWRIDHEHHVNRGYVYSSNFISDADAEAEFRQQNPKVDKVRVVKFRSGRYERSWVGNVVAVGNASGFVELLEATALGNLCTECRNMAVVLHETTLDPIPTARAVYNNLAGKEWDDIRDFLAVHYNFNTRKDNAFWWKCRTDIPLRTAQPLLDFYRENGPSWLANNSIFAGLHPFGLESYYTMFLGMKLPHDKPHARRPMSRHDGRTTNPTGSVSRGVASRLKKVWTCYDIRQQSGTAPENIDHSRPWDRLKRIWSVPRVLRRATYDHRFVVKCSFRPCTFMQFL